MPEVHPRFADDWRDAVYEQARDAEFLRYFWLYGVPLIRR